MQQIPTDHPQHAGELRLECRSKDLRHYAGDVCSHGRTCVQGAESELREEEGKRIYCYQIKK